MIGNEIWILFGIIFGIAAYLGTILRITVRHRIDLVDWFTFAFGSFNGFSFSFIIFVTYNGKNDWLWTQWILTHRDLYGIYLASSLLFLISTWAGATLQDFRRFGKNHSGFSGHKQSEKHINIRISLISWTMLFIAIISYYVYVKGYGGVSNLLEFAPFIRSGRFDLIAVSNPWTFLERFGSFSFFSSFVFFGLLLYNVRNKKFNLSTLIGFIISFALSLTILYIRRGRLSLVSYLIVFPIGFSLFRYKISFKTILILIILGIIAVFILIPQTNLILKRGTEVTDISQFYAREMSFPYVSFFAEMDSGEYRFMKDVFLTPIYILPDRILKGLLEIKTASDINTVRIMGATKGEYSSVTSEIPVDILTFAFMQGGIFGLFAVGFLWGIFLLFIDSYISFLPSGVKEILYAFSIINVSILTIPYGDSRHFLLENIFFVVGIIAFYVFGIGRSKNQQHGATEVENS